MKAHRMMSLWLAMLTIASLLLAACAPSPTPATPAATSAPATSAPATAVPATKPPDATTPPEATSAVEPTAGAEETAAPGEMVEVDCDYGGELKAIKVLDDHTVEFDLCFPDPAFLSKIAFASFAIHDKDYLEKNAGAGDMLRNPNGTGPYKFVEWVEGDHVTFEANENYWGDAPLASTLIFRWSSEASARLLELQAGTVDGIDNPNPNDFEAIEADSTLTLLPRPPLNVFYIGLNNTIPPFDNEEVRQAVYMAIDKQRIVDDFYPGGSEVATQFLPPALKPGYTEGFEDFAYDPVKAAEMLRAAGVEEGTEIELSYRDVVRGYLPQVNDVAQDIQSQLAEVGLVVTLNVVESAEYIPAASAGEYPIFLLGWGADYPDATNFLDYHFGKGANDSFGTHWPDIEDLLAEAASLSDPAERQALYDQANELIKQHVPMIPVAHGASGAAFRADVEGSHTSPIGNEQFAVMAPGDRDTFVWMQNAEPSSLYCADESDGETLRACEQVQEALLGFEVGGTAVVPALAEECVPNEDLTVWTCKLREGVTFHDGAEFTAEDVLATYVAMWDASSPNHTGRSGTFDYWTGFFGAFINVPAEPAPTP